MYLKQIAIENSGPLRRVDLDFAFTESGLPKPMVLVGSNGGGKSNLLSLATDALFEAAAVHYDNVLPAVGLGRAWFRMVGGQVTTVGTAGGFSLLRFEDGEDQIIYREKAGDVDPKDAALRIPAQFKNHLDWKKEGAFKQVNLADEKSKRIFADGVYAYFPSSRSEAPMWLNRESIPETEFDVSSSISKKLRKPIYVDKSLQGFKQWIISVIVESRSQIAPMPGNPSTFQILGNISETLQSTNVLEQCNALLRLVLDDDHTYFAWSGRKSPQKVVVARNNTMIIPSLDGLSGGQSILLGLFGTLIRYADQSQPGPGLDLSAVEGICIVDEIDAHIHVDLQYKTLPNLMRLFPKLQFTVSSHSPLFVLGMKKTFGEEGFQLVEMPGGNIVTSETYSEFGRAMEALSATETFNKKLLSEASKKGLPVVFVEGETDSPYLQRAAELLDRKKLLDRCEIQWIGARGEGGQGFHTGKDALNHTFSVLRANPKLANRAVLLLYDNDAQKADKDCDDISVRSMPTNPLNTKVKAGIENLLASSTITGTDYKVVESTKANGDMHTMKTLRKAELCERVCREGSKEDFSAFGLALDVIEGYLDWHDKATAGSVPAPISDSTS